jgi:hypothetical protein
MIHNVMPNIHIVPCNLGFKVLSVDDLKPSREHDVRVVNVLWVKHLSYIAQLCYPKINK